MSSSPQLVENAIQIRNKRGTNPRSLANLTAPKFVRGGPGGPGRPRKTPLMREMERLAKERAEAKAFARSQFDIAQNPENGQAVAAAKMILDRVEGPVVQESRQLVAAQIVIVSDMPEPEWDRD